MIPSGMPHPRSPRPDCTTSPVCTNSPVSGAGDGPRLARARRGARTSVLALACVGLAVTGCAASPTPGGGGSASGSASASATPRATYEPVPEATTTAAAPTAAASPAEVDTRSPRLAVSYDGGVLVLDALTGKVLGDLPAKGFTRLNPVGDERHVMLTEGDAFRVLDMGAWSEPHGDHAHRYAGAPRPTQFTFASKKPGHVVVHDGFTVLYGDGNGKVESFPSDAMLMGKAPATTVWTEPTPHHGVAVRRKDGSMVTTVGDAKTRSGVKILDAAGAKVAESTQCPGVHGEAEAADGVLVVGCTDGILVIKGRQLSKITSPDGYGRIGNQAGSEASPVVLGDYKVDKDAELERPRRVSLTDTRAQTLRLVDLPASYSFRSLRRGPKGEGLVLGTDGALRVIDVTAGSVAKQIPVTAPWEEPMEWQKPRPTLYVQGTTAYVTEPSQRLLHLVDLDSATLIRTVQLPRVPNEITGTRG